MVLPLQSTPELRLEAEEAHRETEATFILGEAVLQRARETIHRMKDRLRGVIDDCGTAREEPRD